MKDAVVLRHIVELLIDWRRDSVTIPAEVDKAVVMLLDAADQMDTSPGKASLNRISDGLRIAEQAEDAKQFYRGIGMIDQGIRNAGRPEEANETT